MHWNFISLRSASKVLLLSRVQCAKIFPTRAYCENNGGQKFRSWKWNSLVYISAPLVLCGCVGAFAWLRKDTVLGQGDQVNVSRKRRTLENAIQESRDIIQRVKDEVGAPGIVVGVCVDGEHVWKEGSGYSDVENRVHCNSETVMRIASISKVITMTIVAKLMENNQLDIDKPVQEYVKEFPEKTFEGEKVTITTRHLLSHVSGIRHYETAEEIQKKKQEKEREKKEGKKLVKNENELKMKEYNLKEKYASVKDALMIFKDDELIHKPGTEFLYSTHAWTLVSAVLEGATKKEFPDMLRSLFKELGMTRTYLDENEPLIYGRSRFYERNNKGKIMNTPYVDNSYKWAGGGLLSTVGDLLKFGNVILYSYQWHPNNFSSELSTGIHMSNESEELVVNHEKDIIKAKGLPGYLSRQTIVKTWDVNEKAKCSWDKNGHFALGWAVVPEKKTNGCCQEQRFYISHTGGAVGASSALVILPREGEGSHTVPPSGVVVGIITNLSSVGLAKVAMEIAALFEDVPMPIQGK
ncbi:serine beta-lactamase-like protein LACTB, mitochondrial [Lineus longissimus]|uniref:serine beta-lactamase-like protein LACTB, mitochondrial n=1 Tax=Lineus longissimus TaxID=88925 RepID=UPI00315CFE35